MYSNSVYILLQKADYISKKEIIEGILYDLKKTGIEASVISRMVCSYVLHFQKAEC